MTAAITPW